MLFEPTGVGEVSQFSSKGLMGKGRIVRLDFWFFLSMKKNIKEEKLINDLTLIIAMMAEERE